MNNEKVQKLTNIILLIVYAVITLIAVLHHEVWRDEAQVWLVVRDLNPAGIFEHVRTEGHPLLWYFAVFPLAKIFTQSGGILSMQLLSWVLMIIGGTVLLFRSPLSIWVKIPVLFSAGFVYWYPVISRSYSLIPPLLLLIAFVYPKRFEHPFLYALLVILPAHTHLLIYGVSLGLSLSFLFECYIQKKTNIKNSLVLTMFLGAGMLFPILYLWGSQNENIQVLQFMDSGLKPHIFETFMLIVNNLYGTINFPLLIIFYGSILSFLILFYFCSKKIFFIFLCGLGIQTLIYKFVWYTSPEKAALVPLMLLFCVWLIYKNLSKRQKIFASVLLVLLYLPAVPVSKQLISNDLHFNYSSSKDIARYINTLPEDAFIIANDDIRSASVLAYLPRRRFYETNTNNFYTYTVWVKRDKGKPAFALLKNKKIYYLAASKCAKGQKELYVPEKFVLIATERFAVCENVPDKI